MARTRRANIQETEAPKLPEKLLDIDGVMKLLSVGRDKVFELIREQGLPHIKWGTRTLRFDPNKIARWLDSQEA